MTSHNYYPIIENIESKKLRGGYYTPKPIADFITNWVIQESSDSVLEPSCGDGEFIQSIIERFIILHTNQKDIANNINAIEINFEEAKKSLQRFCNAKIKPRNDQIIVGDFFNYCKSYLANQVQFDCIVGNPPFIRYQDFPDEQKKSAFALMKRAGLNPTKLINTWIPFLVSSTLLLKNNGKIGLVIPAELFQVNYAAETRKFLSETYSRLYIITFKKLVFKNIQQEIVIILGEKNTVGNHDINVIEINDLNDLKNIDLNSIKNTIKPLNHTTDKWTQYFLNYDEIELLKMLKSDPSLPLSGEYIDVDVGVVTGQNKYFVLPKSIIKKFNLENFVIKILGKASHVKGIIVTEQDWQTLIDSESPNYLLQLPNIEYNKFPEEIKKYIDYGIELGYNNGYKCRNRKHWWSIPSIWTPDAFMLRQVHNYPKLITNNCAATATDTLHRVRFINGLKGNLLVPAFLNSLTFAFSEITGRSYGGGVLTFEPSEAEKIPLPIKNANELDIKEIDSVLKNEGIEAVLKITDNILLKSGLKLSNEEITKLNNIWKKLRDRRIYRNN